MRRWLVPAVAAAVFMVAGCAPQPQNDPDSSAPVSFNGALRLVAALRLDGGFLSAGLVAIRAPSVAVYSDGRAIADANRTLTLPTQELSDLVKALRQELAGQPATVQLPINGRTVTDHATTVLQVRAADGRLQSVSAYALEVLKGYPERLYSARERLSRLTDRVLGVGTPYASDKVRLVAEERTNAKVTTAAQPWPVDVVVPSIVDSQLRIRVADLSGTAATTTARLLPHDELRTGGWPLLRTKDGLLLAVSWRYLLPDE